MMLVLLLFLFNAAFARVTIRLNREIVHKNYRNAEVLKEFPSEAQPDVDVYGSRPVYWFYVNIGTPSVSFPVSIDLYYTGRLSIPEVGCQGCNIAAPNAQYDKDKSSSSIGIACSPECNAVWGCNDGYCVWRKLQPFACDWNDTEVDCLLQGHDYRDLVSIGDLPPLQTPIVGIFDITSNWNLFQDIGGSMGFAFYPGDGYNPLDWMYNNGYWPQNEYSMCFYPGSKSNGTLILGGVEPSLGLTPLVYTPNKSASGKIALNMTGITIGDSPFIVDTVDAPLWLDNTSPVMFFPDQVYNSISNYLLNNCSNNPLVGVCGATPSIFDGACFQLTPEQISQYPPLVINLDNGSLIMAGKDYLVPKDDDKTTYCYAIENSGSDHKSLYPYSLLGWPLLKNYYISLDKSDRKNYNPQVGFAPVNPQVCGSI